MRKKRSSAQKRRENLRSLHRIAQRNLASMQERFNDKRYSKVYTKFKYWESNYKRLVIANWSKSKILEAKTKADRLKREWNNVKILKGKLKNELKDLRKLEREAWKAFLNN